MSTEIVFETHSWSDDNEAGIATGWLPGRLSQRGRELATDLGTRRRNDGIATVFTSDLRRAAQTATLAFPGTDVPVLLDWRLRECDYGLLNGTAAADLHANRMTYLDTAYPGGESWREAVERTRRFLADLPTRWDGARVLIIGHRSTKMALDHFIVGVPLETLVAAEFAWQEGWEYRMPCQPT